MKSKRNTVWVVLTCMLAILVFVLSAALYRSWKITGVLRTQLAEAQNGVFAMEVVQGQQDVAAAGQVQAVRVMDGILQQQDAGGQWVDVAPVEELAQADPILTGRNKMQELIAQNKEAVQNGTISAEQISPLLAKQSLMVGAALASASQIQSTIKKTTVQTVKPIANKAVATTPAATSAPTQQPTINNASSSSGSRSDSGSSGGSSSGGGSDSGSGDSGSSGGSSDSGSGDSGSSGGGSDSGSGDSGSSGGGSDSGSGDSGSSGGGSDSGSGDSGSSGGGSDSGSTDGGDGEDVGWTDEVL